jgi:hypothetical protein
MGRVRSSESSATSPERAALSVAWLATTAAAILLAVGPATDHLFLGLRNWGFVLTVALLGTTQLSAVAAELGRRWLEERPDRSARRPLSLAAVLIGLTGSAVLGFHVVLRASVDVARECMVRSLCDRHGVLTGPYLAEIAIGLAPLLAVLLLTALFPPNGLGGKGGMQLYGVAFVATVVWHLWVTLHAGPLGGQALLIPGPGGIPPRAPDLAMARSEPPGARERLFDIRPFVPFHYEGPAVWRRAAARTLPVAFAYEPLNHPVTPITHVFRSWRYQVLVSAGLDPAVEDRVLAVTSPPLRLATTVFMARDLREALRLLAHGTRDVSAAVVEAGPRELSAFAGSAPAEPGEGVGSIQIEHFAADSIRLRVRTRRPALLVYADGYDPEWSASVDGASVAVYPADVIGKAVPVPAGESRVDFVYRPWLYIVGSALRALALLAAGGVGLGSLVCRFGR